MHMIQAIKEFALTALSIYNAHPAFFVTRNEISSIELVYPTRVQYTICVFKCHQPTILITTHDGQEHRVCTCYPLRRNMSTIKGGE